MLKDVREELTSSRRVLEHDAGASCHERKIPTCSFSHMGGNQKIPDASSGNELIVDESFYIESNQLNHLTQMPPR